MAVIWEALALKETTVANLASGGTAPIVWEILQAADLAVSLPGGVLPLDKWELLQTTELTVATSTLPSPVVPPAPSGGTPSWVLPVVIGGAALLLLTPSKKKD